MERIPCPQCEKTFRKETGLNWHLKQAHSESRGDNQSGRASMAQETPEKRKTTFAELQEATKTVKWTSPIGGTIVRALVSLDVLDDKDVPKEVLEQPEPRLAEPPATPIEAVGSTEEKREVYISYVKAGS